MTPQRILFGSGSYARLPEEIERLGERACLVTGANSFEASGELRKLATLLRERKVAWRQVKVAGEPTVAEVDEAVRRMREFKPEVVVAIGGGSALDAGKAIAALLANRGKVMDYLEGVGRGKLLKRASLPLIAVPTTAGTGSEATRNAVLLNRERGFKRSLRGDGMLPTVAIVDPDLTLACPPEVTAACGMDAITQLIEGLISRRSNPITDSLAITGLAAARQFEVLLDDPENAPARQGMALASLNGGIVLSNAGLGVVHALSSPLGAMFDAPHGALCAALLPAAVRLNGKLAVERGELWVIEKFSAVLINLFEELDVDFPGLTDDEAEEADVWDELLESAADEPGAETDDDATASGRTQHGAAGGAEGGSYPADYDADDADGEDEDADGSSGIIEDPLAISEGLAHLIERLNAELHIKPLRAYGVLEADFPRIIEHAGSGNLKTNCVELEPGHLRMILEQSF